MPEKKRRQTSERWMQGTCCMQGARSRVVGELTKDVLTIVEHNGAASAACRCDSCMLLLRQSCGSTPAHLIGANFAQFCTSPARAF